MDAAASIQHLKTKIKCNKLPLLLQSIGSLAKWTINRYTSSNIMHPELGG